MSEKKKKPSRVKARLPKGMRDIKAAELRGLRDMLATITSVYERYGFEPLDTPAFEYTDCLGKFLPDTDRPNEGVFSFQDEDEQWMSMRYDLTAPLARYVAQNFDQIPKPFRRYQSGFVYRNEKPGPGRFRQFMQFDADTVGTANPAADAEMCMLAADTLEAFGLAGNYVIKVSNRKIVDGVLDAIGLGGDENTARRLTVLRTVDKLDKLGLEGVQALLAEGRKDESGDFTVGAKLDAIQIRAISQFLAWQAVAFFKNSYKGLSQRQFLSDLNSAEALIGENVLIEEGLSELYQTANVFRAAGYDHDRIQIDPSVVRGLEYYTGAVFEAELTFPAVDEKGQPIRFGSVGGGGRYDGLVSRFVSQPTPAVGISIGVSRLYAALSHLGKLSGQGQTQGPVVVLVLDKVHTGDCTRMAQELRAASIRAEMYVGDAGLKAQMKYADRRGAPCVIIQGEDERAKGEVTIKDLAEGAKLAAGIADHAEWREGRPAQFSVPTSELVQAVRSVLERPRA